MTPYNRLVLDVDIYNKLIIDIDFRFIRKFVIHLQKIIQTLTSYRGIMLQNLILKLRMCKMTVKGKI